MGDKWEVREKESVGEKWEVKVGREGGRGMEMIRDKEKMKEEAGTRWWRIPRNRKQKRNGNK